MVAFFAASLFASTPLAPPDIDGDLHEKQQALKRCKVPAEVAILPPPIDKDYKDCVSDYYKPSVAKAQKALTKQGVISHNAKILTAKRAKNLTRAYIFEIKGAKDKILCDDLLTSCYKVVDDLQDKDKK